MRRSAQLSALVLVAALQAGALHARLPYKTIIDKLDAKTEREKHFQKEVKKSKCNSCHEKKKKKVLIGIGKELEAALGGKDFKYEKALFAKVDGKYSDKAIALVRKAINKKPEKK